MKKYFALLLMLPLAASAQIPNGYYNGATGTGMNLKTQLYNIIKGHNAKSYNALYTCYLTSDRDYFYENDGTVLDIYSERPSANDPYTYSATNTGDRCGNYSVEGDCYNREHLMPQSVFNEGSPMVSDAHHIFPTDGKVNGMRGNLPFGKVGTANWTSQNGSKRGNNSTSGYSGVVFEPIDEFKGDVARALLYFATRYQNTIANYDHDMLNGTSGQAFSPWFLDIVLTWHLQDPVSAREIARNNAVYEFQGNRNPYIDHPEYVASIWGMPLGVPSVEFSKVSVFPNPAKDHRITIQSEIDLDEIELISVSGQIVQKITKPQLSDRQFPMENLPNGFYLLRLTSGNQSVTKKVIVN